MLTFWRISEKSLSVNHITTFRAEVFYWLTILFSNTLGTALGDFLADSSGLGFAGGALLIAGLLAVQILHRACRLARTAFGLRLGIARHVTDNAFRLAGEILGRTGDPILVHPGHSCLS